jgi:Predicted deacylase
MENKLNKFVAVLVTALLIVTMVLGYRYFSQLWEDDYIIPSEYVTEIKWLSDYHPPLKGTRGDTRIFFIDSGNPGATVAVNGGTHPDEISGVMGAMILVERAKPEVGRLIVIPQMNNSGFTHNFPQEATPLYYHLQTADGETRRFRTGGRGANSIDYWPDPEVFSHYQTGQKLSGEEVRNLNRNFPGRPDGSFMEQVGYAIFKVLLDEKVDLNIDLHEAWPEYPFVNAMGAGKNSDDLASLAALDMRMEGIEIGVESAAENFRGLTYRELPEYSDAYAILAETANPGQGRIRGITDETLMINGQDAFYVRASDLGHTFVPIDENGWPLKVRVARHLATVSALLRVFNELNPDKPFEISNIPSYDEAIEVDSIGYFLNSPKNES